MDGKLNLILILSIFISLINSQEEINQLRWTFELINHGARSPHKDLDSNFKDFSNHTWIGQNELTGVGLRQSTLIGFRDKIRYIEEKKLISDIYDPRDILVYSSENNRTLMSANALLHGLFPPGTGPTIDPSLVDRAVPPVNSELYKEEKDRLDSCNNTALPDRMSLVPVHVYFDHEFFTQYETSKKCKSLNTYEEKNKKREDVVNFLKEMNRKYYNIDKIFPNQGKTLEDYEFAYTFFDTLLSLYYEAADEFDTIIKLLNMDGKEEDVINDCKEFLFNKNIVGYGIDNDKDFINYLISPLFNKIIHFIDLKISKDSSKEESYHGYDLPKYYLISAVGNTCGTFMSFMNKYFNTSIKPVEYGVNLHLELYLKNKTGEPITENNYILEYYYNDEFLLSIPYTEFKQKIKNELYNSSEIINFCSLKEEEEDDTNYYLIGTIIGGVIVVILLIVIIIVFRKRKLENDDIDSDNPTESEGLVRDTRISS